MSDPVQSEPVLIVSADGHVSPPLEEYRAHLEPAFHGALAALATEDHEYITNAAQPFSPSPASLAVYDNRGVVRSGGETGAYDLARRLVELDAEGVAAEVIHWGAMFHTMPFFDISNLAHPVELRAAGARAYNHWLADWMAPSQGRIRGVLQPGPCRHIDELVAELRWGAAHGFVAVQVPGGTADPELANLADARWEPFWATAAELRLALSVHAGWGHTQGDAMAFFATFASMGMGDIDMDQFLANAANSPLVLDIGPRRVIWQLMLAGVFDRHPALRLVLTEVRADWIPATLAFLDRWFEQHPSGLTMAPSEYFRRHIYVTPSSPHRAEIQMRHQIGVDRLMFGVDYPHIESTWPNTFDWIRDSFAGVPEIEARQILGGNAIEAYGLDTAALAPIAARIGPRPEEILGAGHQVAPALIDHFHKRAGYLRAPDPLDEPAYESALQEDIVVLAGTPRP